MDTVEPFWKDRSAYKLFLLSAKQCENVGAYNEPRKTDLDYIFRDELKNYSRSWRKYRREIKISDIKQH